MDYLKWTFVARAATDSIYEVDFIEVHDEKIKAIEIKKTDREMKQLKLFTKKYENVEPLMVTYDKEEHDDINVMPLWVFLLQWFIYL